MKALLLSVKCLLVLLIFRYPHLNAQVPPTNPFLIDSPFPFVHQNNYRQGYSDLPALLNQDEIQVRLATVPRENVSPWLLLSEQYPDGSRTIWGSSTTHIWKAISTESGLSILADYRIDFERNDRSWSFLMMRDKRVLTSDNNRLLVFTEADPTNPASEIILEREIFLPQSLGQPVKFNRMYDGTITFATNSGYFGLLDADLRLLDTLRLDLQAGERIFEPDETAFHNDYASDERGGIFTVTTRRMLRLQVADRSIVLDWAVTMDFGGNGLQGVGTTPTLLGTDDDPPGLYSEQ